MSKSIKSYRAKTSKIKNKISVSLAAELLGVSVATVYNWLKEKKLLSLEPQDIRYMIESRALKKRKGRPRGRPFERKDDPRRHSGF